jgi:hypothetical protein
MIDITYPVPICYQHIKGSKVLVDGSYDLLDGSTIGFNITQYDPNYNLVIDPLISIPLPGVRSMDWGGCVAVDRWGNAYVTGATDSMNFPTTREAFDGARPRIYNKAFVTKLNPSGSDMLYSTYLGGTVKTLDTPWLWTVGAKLMSLDEPNQ